MGSARSRIEELRRLLRAANVNYYVHNAPTMSDQEYDELLIELGSLEKANPQFDDPDSPTRRVGGEPVSGFQTVAHAQPMLSIDNTYNEVEVRAWVARTEKELARDEGESQASDPLTFVADPKIDGVALSARYENGRLTQVLTRGDGERGDDITANARAIRALPLRLESDTAPVPSVLEVRGEAFLPWDSFKRINARGGWR